MSISQITFIGSGSDAPGHQLVFKDGHWTVVPTPGWGIDAMVELSNVLQAASHGARLKSTAVQQQVVDLLANHAVSELQRGKIDSASVVVVSH